jgi:hypothetical protein
MTNSYDAIVDCGGHNSLVALHDARRTPSRELGREPGRELGRLIGRLGR